MHLAYDPSISLVGINPKEMKSYIHTKTCIQMTLAALFINCQKLKTTQMFFSGSIVVQRNTTE